MRIGSLPLHPLMDLRSWLGISLAMIMPCLVHAQQEYPISSNPTIQSCSGALTDSGASASDYGNNENFTTVICPDVPGDVINIQWVVWSLDMSGAQNTWDRILIWDGDNTGATLLGEYNGSDLLSGSQFQATTMNPTGCLTVQFISNGTGVGNFAAIISCETPCDRPTAAGTMNEGVPALICMGETLNFDGSASVAAQGFNIASYTWDFADGTTANTPTASHSWNEPGEYVVQLYVVDDNGCINTNLIDLQVFVSTVPDFSATAIADSSYCLGANITLSAQGTEATTWTGVPETGNENDFFIDDLIGVPFTSEITFTQFLPGQTLTSCEDIQSICIDFEHSFMGDLVITLTCPNGSVQTLHQQNGGGTNLGIPGPGEEMGTPYNYCWSPTATNGTWAASSGGQPTLPAGTYAPVETCDELVGCPLNGTWTLTFVDLWLADDGWLFGWDLNINPALIPDVTEFTPVLGLNSPDSAGWSGAGLIVDPTNPLLAQAVPPGPGDYTYTFSVTDNFGCTYDTSMTITIDPPMEIDAGPDIVLCNDPVAMAGAVVANPPTSNCVWTLILFDTLGDGWDGASITVNNDGVSTNYTMNFGLLQQSIPITVTSGNPLSLQYFASVFWNNEHSFRLVDQSGAIVYQSIQGPPSGVLWNGLANCGPNSGVIWSWSPANGLTDATDPTTDVFTTQPTLYYLSAYPSGFPECAVTDSVLVSPDPSISAGDNATMVICASEPTFLMTDSLGGTPDLGGVWTDGSGNVMPDTFDPEFGLTGLYTYTVTSAAGCQASATLDITVIPADDPTCCGVADAGEPNFSCNLSIALSATPGNTGTGIWSGPVGAVFADANAPQTTVSVQPGMGGSHWFYWIEDDGAFCYLIDSVQMTFTDTIVIAFTHTDAVCFTYCDGTAQAAVTGGNAAAGFTFDWSNGDNGVGLDAVTDLCDGTYTLTVTDDNGCTGTNEVVISEPVLLEIDSLASQPVTCSGDCDGQVEVYDPEALWYSYDDGATWSNNPVMTDACEGIYPIRIRNAADCIGTGSIVVTGPPPVVASFEWGPIPANVEDPTIFFNTTSTGSDHYLWDIAGLTSSTLPNPSYTFTNKEPGTYNVCLVAYNYNECPDTICNTVIIDDVLFTYIPNSFTPDGDGVNETWGMSTNMDVITSYELTVFDRWGQVVYNTTDPYQAGWWKGSYQNGGEILKSDVYAYRISYEIRGTEVRKEFMGHVTLLK